MTPIKRNQLPVHNIVLIQTKKSSMCVYYGREKERISAHKRDKYTFSEPKPITKDAHLKDLESNLLGNKKNKDRLD